MRTAEVDWFGAERLLTLARAAADGRIAAAAAERSPAEVQVVTLGPWTWVAWPSEVFVEFSLELKTKYPDVDVISYANGEYHGYIVTRGAVEEGGYEAVNALFQSPESGEALVRETLAALRSGDAIA